MLQKITHYKFRKTKIFGRSVCNLLIVWFYTDFLACQFICDDTFLKFVAHFD